MPCPRPTLAWLVVLGFSPALAQVPPAPPWQPLAASSPAASAPVPEGLLRAQIDTLTAQAAYYRAEVGKGMAPQTPAWLQTVLGGVLAIVGGGFSAMLSSRMADLKRRQASVATYGRQKSQIRLSVKDLLAALDRIPPPPQPVPAFLSERLVYESPIRPSSADRGDSYYLKYDLVDTIYRFCALLGWLELYRIDPGFLRGPEGEKIELERAFAGIRSALAAAFDDERSAHPEVTQWHDGFVLEDDQRAIGEQMLVRLRSDTSATVMGYAGFCERLFRDPAPDNPTDGTHPLSQNWWIWNATRFFVEMGASPPGADVRRIRLVRLVAHLTALLAALD